jgi:alpha-glucosidase
MIRWMQLGALSPFFRNHSAKGTKRQEFTEFDVPTQAAIRNALRLRYHLLPYIYDLAHEDLPILRPLVLEYPKDPVCRELTDQFMVGDTILCAPVTEKDAVVRTVVLPVGRWKYCDGTVYEGGCTRTVTAPLNVLPIFEKIL